MNNKTTAMQSKDNATARKKDVRSGEKPDEEDGTEFHSFCFNFLVRTATTHLILLLDKLNVGNGGCIQTWSIVMMAWMN